MKKHVVNACLACRRRKVKCVGNPCAYCLKKNYVCEFKEPTKKRGPKVKLPSEVDVLQNNVLIQEAMGKMCMQQDYVEFYFECIGIQIPKSYKNNFYFQTDNHSELRTQLYIIMANTMKAYGNKDLEIQYINKAQKCTSLFEGDTFESAVSLIMMANYIGNDKPKARNFILMAQNTLTLPTIKETETVKHTKQVCDTLLTVYNPSISKHQKANYILSGLINLDLCVLSETVSCDDIITVGIACISNLLFLKGNFDTCSVPEFLQSTTQICTLNEPDRVFILQYIYKFEELLKFLQTKDSKNSAHMFALFLIRYYTFVVEWKSGHVDVAFQAALQTMEVFKANSQIIAVRSFGTIVRLLSLPYFFQTCGATDQFNQTINCIANAFETIGKKEEQRIVWEEMCGTLLNYNMIQLEEELLGSPPTM